MTSRLMLTPCPNSTVLLVGSLKRGRPRRESSALQSSRTPCTAEVSQHALAAQLVDAAGWRVQQEHDTDLQPVLQWVESGKKLWWKEAAGCSPATKGLFEKFAELQVKHGVLQGVWKEPATEEHRWQVVVPRVLRESVLKACHGIAGAGHFRVSKTLNFTGVYWGQV